MKEQLVHSLISIDALDKRTKFSYSSILFPMQLLIHILRIIFIIALVISPAASAIAKELPAVIINSNSQDKINISYFNGVLEYTTNEVLPKSLSKIPFNINSFTPTTVFVTTEKYIGLCFAVMPGDTVSVDYDNKLDTYSFAGKHKQELVIYKRFGESKFSLRSFIPLATYNKNKGFKPFLDEWHNAWLASEENIQQLQLVPNIRPEVKKHFALEARLHLFQALLAPIDLQEPTEAIQTLSASYRDTVTLYAKKLLIPAYDHKSPQIAYMLRGYAMFTAAVEGKHDSHAIQYVISKRDYKGYQRELACYSALKDMFTFNTNPDSLSFLVKDYQTWASPTSSLFKKISELQGFNDRSILTEVNLNDNIITLENKKLKLFDIINKYRGKVIYLDLWASWCGPCVAEIPTSLEMSKNYKQQDFVVLYLSIDDDQNKWLKASSKYLGSTNRSYRFKNTNESAFTKAFKIKFIPRYMIIDKKGVLRHSNAPNPDNPKLKNILDKLIL